MIIYDLECDASHRFEGWFKNASDYENQLATKLLTCPICHSEQVKKLPSATHINKNRTQAAPSQRTLPKEIVELQKLQQYVENNFDNVGTQFAEEVKKIHYGEAEDRNIYGTATINEVVELKDEGIEALPIPLLKDKKELN
ncbi:MAG: DUF1178 family protein [Gammaproteobacteria bacterium]|nr:DUF1178 family protein [Gammaproteobacteria bacterium]MDH5777142.1 DUF1178 family protein [Gammaproteobacteria bacterium]